MGLDLGFKQAGFSTRYANDITKFACDTIRENTDIPCDEEDITNIPSTEILRKASLEDVDVVIGGPPCQSFSTAGKRRGFGDKRGIALLQYIRVINDLRPKFFVFENVPGIRSAAKKHVPFFDRMAGAELTSSQEYGSLFMEIMEEFRGITGYDIGWQVLNAADYGVPQKRKRFILIGSRTVNSGSIFCKIKKKPGKTLRDALDGLVDPEKECAKFPKWGKYLKYVPSGGCWVDLPDDMKREAMGGAYDSDDPKKKGKQGGRRGFYRRLSWDAPAPTLVTSPVQLASCLCHPDEDRPLSVREYARIQGFPDDWKFVGTTAQKYKMIGEAVPVGLAKVIAEAIKTSI